MPIAGIFRVPNVMVVHPSVPAKTVPEFIAYAKANPGKINVELPGTGTSSHMAGELFKLMTGVDLVHIQYRGNGPALIDLLAGQVQVGFDTMPASIEYIRAGKLRALAVCTAYGRSGNMSEWVSDLRGGAIERHYVTERTKTAIARNGRNSALC